MRRDAHLRLARRALPAALGGFLLAGLAWTGLAVANPQRPVCPGLAGNGTARCMAHVVTDGHGTPSTAVAPPASWYGPAQFHGAYQLPVATRAGAPAQTIAIVDAYDDPTIRADLTEYDRAYGIGNLESCKSTSEAGCFLKINQKGETRSYPKSNSGWALEIALDVETAHEICQTCKVVLVEASSSSSVNLDAAEEEAVKLGATEISNSWGSESEYSGETAENKYFNHPGIAITVASGDRGYGHFGFPAASPDVIDAGGTALTVKQEGGSYAWSGETAWSGSGSGCSLYFGAETWQLGATGWKLTGCAKRGVADVAADADPETGAAVYDTTKYIGVAGWFHVGGTSLASPLIASVYALAGNAAGVSYPAKLPYGSPTSLHDVTQGPSTGNCSTTACKAAEGYDGPTGLGTPKGLGAF